MNVSHLLHSVRGPPAVPHQTQDNPTSTANSSTPAVVHGPPREQNAGSQRVAESQVYSLTQLYALPSHTNPMPKKHFMKPADIKYALNACILMSILIACVCRFVVSRVLQPLETMDPFHDDYYYLQVDELGAIGMAARKFPSHMHTLIYCVCIYGVYIYIAHSRIYLIHL